MASAAQQELRVDTCKLLGCLLGMGTARPHGRTKTSILPASERVSFG